MVQYQLASKSGPSHLFPQDWDELLKFSHVSSCGDDEIPSSQAHCGDERHRCALRAWPKARAGDNTQQMLGVGGALRYSIVPKCTAWKSIFPSIPPSPVSLRSRNQKDYLNNQQTHFTEVFTEFLCGVQKDAEGCEQQKLKDKASISRYFVLQEPSLTPSSHQAHI